MILATVLGTVMLVIGLVVLLALIVALVHPRLRERWHLSVTVEHDTSRGDDEAKPDDS